MFGVAFDLSKTRTGVALMSKGKLVQTLSWSYQHHPYFGDVLLDFERNLLHTLSVYGPHWLAYEEVRPVNKYHSELHFGMVGVLAMRAAQHEVPLIGVNTGTMRKEVLGRGRLIKDEVLEAVRARLSEKDRWMVTNHDVADAVTVGWYASSIVIPGGMED